MPSTPGERCGVSGLDTLILFQNPKPALCSSSLPTLSEEHRHYKMYIANNAIVAHELFLAACQGKISFDSDTTLYAMAPGDTLSLLSNLVPNIKLVNALGFPPGGLIQSIYYSLAKAKDLLLSGEAPQRMRGANHLLNAASLWHGFKFCENLSAFDELVETDLLKAVRFISYQVRFMDSYLRQNGSSLEMWASEMGLQFSLKLYTHETGEDFAYDIEWGARDSGCDLDPFFVRIKSRSDPERIMGKFAGIEPGSAEHARITAEVFPILWTRAVKLGYALDGWRRVYFDTLTFEGFVDVTLRDASAALVIGSEYDSGTLVRDSDGYEFSLTRSLAFLTATPTVMRRVDIQVKESESVSTFKQLSAKERAMASIGVAMQFHDIIWRMILNARSAAISRSRASEQTRLRVKPVIRRVRNNPSTNTRTLNTHLRVRYVDHAMPREFGARRKPKFNRPSVLEGDVLSLAYDLAHAALNPRTGERVLIVQRGSTGVKEYHHFAMETILELSASGRASEDTSNGVYTLQSGVSEEADLVVEGHPPIVVVKDRLETRHLREVIQRRIALKDPELAKLPDKRSKQGYIANKRTQKYRWILDSVIEFDPHVVVMSKPLDARPQSAMRSCLLGAAVGLASASVVRGVRSVIHNVNKFLDRASKTMDLAGVSLANIGRKLESQFTDCAKVLEGSFKGVARRTLMGIAAIVVVPVLYLFLVKTLGSKIAKGVVVLALSAIVAKYFGQNVWEALSPHFSRWTPKDSDDASAPLDAEVQSGNVVGALPAIVTALFTASVLKDGCNHRATTEFLRRVSVVDKACNGFSTLGDWIVTALQALFNAARRMFGKEAVEFRKHAYPALRQWTSDVDKLHGQTESLSSSPSPELVDHMVSLCVAGAGFKETYKFNRELNPIVERTYQSLLECLRPFQGAISARNNYRVEPLAFMLVGEAGIGKTLLAPYICSTVMLESGLVAPDSTFADMAKQMWQKGPSRFWNSYSGQACLIMDDAFQRIPTQGDESSEYLDIIKMVGTWAMPLDFADLASKGKIFFNSPFIFGTTNNMHPIASINSVVVCADAVLRRLHHSYRLVVRPDYLTAEGRLDYVKFVSECRRLKEDESETNVFPWHIWSVIRHDFDTGEAVGDPLPLLQVVRNVARQVKQRKESAVDGLQQLEEYVTHLSASRRVVATPQSGLSEMSGEPDSVKKAIIKPFLPHLCERAKDFLRNDPRVLPTWLRVGLGVAGFVLLTTILKGVVSATVGVVKGIGKILGIVKPRKRINATVESNFADLSRANRGVPTTLQAFGSPVHDKLYGNLYKLSIAMASGNEAHVGHVFFVYDGVMCLPGHYVTEIEGNIEAGLILKDAMVTLRNAKDPKMAITLAWPIIQQALENRCVLGGNEIQFISLPVRPHSRVVQNCIREADIKSLGGHVARLDVSRNEATSPMLSRHTYHAGNLIIDSGASHIDYVLPVNGKSKRMNVDRCARYSAVTKRGDCGGFLSLADNTAFGGRTLVGFHIAGNEGVGQAFAAILTQEMLSVVARHFKVVIDESEADITARGVTLQCADMLPFSRLQDKEIEDESLTHSLQALYSVPHGDRPITSVKTAYRLSEIGERQPFGTSKLAPARLRGFKCGEQWIEPVDKAISPFSTALHVPTLIQPKRVIATAFRNLFSKTLGCPRTIYTFEESVLGVPGDKFRSIPRGTSAGYPYCLHVKSGKKEFFGNEQDYDLSGPKAKELKARVEHIIDKARQGVRLGHIFNDILKDELRAPEKVAAGKTRLVNSSPLDYTIAWRMYFGAFTSALMRKHTDTGMCPGICPYTDWNKLRAHLTRKGEKVFDGDFSGFDSTQVPVVLDLFLDVVNEWYADGEENARIRKVLWLDLVSSRHIGGAKIKSIYLWLKSLPSGHPFTTIANSMYSLFALVYSWSRLCVQHGLTVEHFWDCCSPATYGDDNVVNVSDEVADWYNQITIAPVLKESLGMDYTPATKDGNWVPWTSIDKVSFLKRKFRGVSLEYCAAPLELESFLYTAYWYKTEANRDQTIRSNLEMTLRELALHDRSVFDQHAPSVIRELRTLGAEPSAGTSYEAWFDVVSSLQDAWY